MKLLRLVPAIVLIAITHPTIAADLPPIYRSYPLLRMLPTLSQLVRADETARFVDAAKGKDDQNGSEAKPWQTLTHAVEQLTPGNTRIRLRHTTLQALGGETDPRISVHV